MAKARYSVPGNSSALTAATAKTIVAVLAPAQFGADLVTFELSFDSATSTAVPALWELCSLTGATAGTSTAVTVQQVSGRVITAGFTGATNYTAEPTVLTPIRSDFVPVYGGLIVVELPTLGGYDSAVSQGFALRITAPAPVNARGTLFVERC
jgi:hypothetical protein